MEKGQQDMKKGITLLLTAALAATSLTAFAAPATFDTYTISKGTITVDGKADETEWAGAATLTINKDNGNIPSWIENPKVDALEIDYKFKWDENFLYVLEVRKDTKLNFSNIKTGEVMWLGDNTILFMRPDGVTVTQDIQYAAGNKADAKKAVVQKRINNVVSAVSDKTKVASAISGETATTELAISWDEFDGMKAAVKEGGKIRLTPIICQADDNEAGKQSYQFDTAGESVGILCVLGKAAETAETTKPSPSTGEATPVVAIAVLGISGVAAAMILAKKKSK